MSPSAGALVARPRLLARLGGEASLCVLCAPTGFGKSTLVRQWLESTAGRGNAVAAVRVHPGEGDQHGFWISLVDALTDVGVPLPPLAHNRSPQSLASRMIATSGRPLTIWIDNFENVTAESADQVLIELAARVPGLRVIVAMRSLRGFTSRDLRGVPNVTLTAPELLFTRDEIAGLLNAAGFHATGDLVEAVHEGIGGWPALVHALVDVLPRDDGDQLASTMDRVVTEWAQLLPRVPSEGLLDFALASSVPESVTPAIARLIGDDEAATEYVDQLAAAGLLTPIAGTGESEFRWASTARAALQQELARRDPARLQRLHQTLGHWYAEQRQAAAALSHATAAQDWQLVTRIIDEHWRELLLRNREALRAAFLGAPAEAFFAPEQLTPARAIRSLFLQLDDEGIDAGILPAEPAELAALGAGEGGLRAIDVALACLLALRTSARWTEAVELSNRLVAVADAARAVRPGEVAGLYASVQFYAGETSLISRDISIAVTRFEHAYRRSDDGPFDYIKADAAAKLALTHALRGELPVAASWLRRHQQAVDDAPATTWLAPFMHATANAARLVLAVDRVELSAASAAESALIGNVLPSTLAIYELYGRALLALSTHRAADALALLDRLRASLGPVRLPRPSEVLLTMIEADAYLALGHGNRVRRILDGPFGDESLLHTTRARLALLAGDTAQVLRLARDNAWERQAGQRHRLEMLTITAIAAHRAGDEQLALASLAHAISGAEPGGMLRPFTTVPRGDLAELASRLPDEQRERIARALDAGREVYPEHIDLIELTPREQDVLDRIAAGQSIRQIAISLQLSYNTIRTQQRSLYRKLEAADRVEALTRAREAGLTTAG